MNTERTQLTSVGQRRIWPLSDALLEKEVFQSARINRDGILTPLLGEETPSFRSTTAVTCRSEESRGSDVTFLWPRQVARASATSCNLLHKSDLGHKL